MIDKPTTKKTREQILREREARRPHFDVTCTIGTVFLDNTGELTAFEAAMLLIARHEAPGTFRFPNLQSGGTIAVTIDHEEDHNA